MSYVKRVGQQNPAICLRLKSIIFKSIIHPEMYDIIVRETNPKGKKVYDTFNHHLSQRYPNVSQQPP